jgi:hypothetical protein
VTTDNVIALFTDLVGSTEFQSSVTPEISDEVRRNHFSALRKAVAETGCPSGNDAGGPKCRWSAAGGLPDPQGGRDPSRRHDSTKRSCQLAGTRPAGPGTGWSRG